MRVFPFSIFLCLSLFTSGCGNNMPKGKPANLHWDVKSVTFYDVYEFNGVDKMSDKELDSLRLVKIEDPQLTHLFSKLSFSDKWALWKGAQLATVDLANGQKIKIKVSNYGNFFSILGQKGFYFFEDHEDKKLWDYFFFGEGLKKQIRRTKESESR